MQQEASKEEAAEERPFTISGGVHESLPDLMIDAKKTVFPCVSWGYTRRRKMAFRPMFFYRMGCYRKRSRHELTGTD